MTTNGSSLAPGRTAGRAAAPSLRILNAVLDHEVSGRTGFNWPAPVHAHGAAAVTALAESVDGDDSS
ncbi:hypothetical protein ACWD3I_40810 [Streptomyces sp. NPDC002817]|uniref:hypothetical protein n=1 Tax=Streptomyces sp. NPDC088357 TaxID=3154655 RepID=UPI00342EF9DD